MSQLWMIPVCQMPVPFCWDPLAGGYMWRYMESYMCELHEPTVSPYRWHLQVHRALA